MATESTDSTVIEIPAGTWRIEPAAGKIEFRVKTMWGLTTVKGRFTSYSGELTVSPEGQAGGQMTVDVTSLDTGNKKRDEHLLSPDFFDAKAHPSMSFVATGIVTSADGISINGQLNVGSKVVDLSLPTVVKPAAEGRILLEAGTEILREHAGLHWNKLGMIRGPVQMSGEIVLVREV